MSEIAENFQEELDIFTAIRAVVETSRNHDKVKIGASEVIRALYQNIPLELIILPSDLLDEYKTIITAKAQELNVPIAEVSSRADLAKAMPFTAKNIGAVGIVDFIYESREKSFFFSGSQ